MLRTLQSTVLVHVPNKVGKEQVLLVLGAMEEEPLRTAMNRRQNDMKIKTTTTVTFMKFRRSLFMNISVFELSNL